MIFEAAQGGLFLFVPRKAAEVVVMARGGARIRSGPRPDPSSARSERRKYVLTALPAEGCSEEPPKFPLPRLPFYRTAVDDDGTERTLIDERATGKRQRRELAVWKLVWSYPQACAWHMEPWRAYTVAMYVRTAVICEGADAMAADKNSLHQFANQIGLSPAGLAENGWRIADQPVALEVVPEDAPVQRRRSRELGA